ncbi:MAG TPA: choice-of-anchor L domain-containing protein [Flavisolibacter sp.]
MAMTSYGQLQVTPVSNAQTLVQKLVGEGVTVMNATFSGASLSSGTFKNLGGNILGIDSGLVFSSGRVQTAGASYGLNGFGSNHASTDMGTLGDPQLDALTNGQFTQDAVILEFDFVPLGDTIKFNYVFSSEEYPDFNCTNYNDVFAFFISGPGIAGVRNIALVPGTNIPVAINSINNGVPAGSISNCTNMGPGSPFVQYYITNSGSTTITHNGHTNVLTAMSPVQPCQVYHLKIAIADASDGIYDSGVFLEAKSLKSDPVKIETTLPMLNGLPYMVEGCNMGGIKILRNMKSPQPQTVTLTYAGNVQNGIDVLTMPPTATIPAFDSVLFIPISPIADNIPEAPEILKIYVSNGCALTNNFYMDSIEIQLRDYDTLIVTPSDTVVCRNTPIQLSAGGTYSSYQWSPAASLNNAGIANPIATPTNTTKYLITASIGDCMARDSVELVVKALELVATSPVNCAGGTSGQVKVSGGGEWKPPVQYSINNGAYGSDSTFSNLPVGNYVVKIKDASACIDSVMVSITLAYPALQLDDSVVSASCNGTNGQVLLTGSGGLAPYTYSTTGSSYSANNTFTVNGGTHMVYVKDANGCVTSHSLTVPVDPQINMNVTLNPNLCSGQSDGMIYVSANGGSGQFQYSIDGTNFQPVDSFLVSTSPVTVTVQDNKGCTATQNVTIPLNDSVFVNAGNDLTICEGTSIQINTTHNASNFTWQAAPTLSSTSIPNPTASPVTTTTYYVTATKGFCTSRDTITVSVNPAPIANAGPGDSVCSGRTVFLQGSGGTGYQWFPAGQVDNPTSANPSVKPLQTTSYFLQVTDANGCTSLKYDTVTIKVVPAIQAFAGNDTFVAINQPLQLLAMDLGNSGVTGYTWSPPFGLSDPNIANPVATLDRDILYTVTLTTPEGCEGTDQVLVKVFLGPEIYVPTAFTPNGDGRNDVLRPIAVGMKEFHYFRVYNRWGEMIFSTNDPDRGWDGTIAGSKQATGTYIWILEAVDFRGNLVQRKGTSTLIR